MTLEEKLKAIIEKARNMDDSCLRYGTIRDHIFAPGTGIAWQLLKSVEERSLFLESPEFSEIQEILDRALKEKRNDLG